MTVGDLVAEVRGYVTQDKYLIGRDLAAIEKLLGFHTGRLALGATFVKLNSLPALSDFELAAYSMTASHRYVAPPNLDQDKLKPIAMSRWSLQGGDRLVKVAAGIAHDPGLDADEQYPPGAGVPQWKLVRACTGTVVAELQTSTGHYKPCF